MPPAPRSWRPTVSGEGARCATAWALNLADDGITRNQAYHDVRCSIFTPRSMSLLFLGLAEAGLHDIECEGFHDTERDEFEFFLTQKASDDRNRMIGSWQKVHVVANDRP